MANRRSEKVNRPTKCSPKSRVKLLPGSSGLLQIEFWFADGDHLPALEARRVFLRFDHGDGLHPGAGKFWGSLRACFGEPRAAALLDQFHLPHKQAGVHADGGFDRAFALRRAAGPLSRKRGDE